jgi:two-component system, chemotaxis family, protein-glutamate methylesterase/glutaminase
VIKVLIVDDSALVRKLLGQVLASEGDFELQFARNGIEALDKLRTYSPDVVTLDVNMPGMDGLACLDRIMVEHPCPVVMVSSLTVDGAAATLDALRLGAVDFVVKPDGAMSLRMDDLAPELVQKIRTAAGAKLRSSLRLTERIRHRIGGSTPNLHKHRARPAKSLAVSSPGDGLVLVGTSTGGPPALEALLTALPGNFPWPILVAQHMPASFTGALAHRLDGLCAVAVAEVSRPTPLQPGHVYVGRGDADLIVTRRSAGLVAMAAPSLRGYPWHPSTDRLVRSAMQHMAPSQIIGVLMTGMGSDGAEAMASLRTAGGRTIAEAEETAVVWGMPGELARINGAEWILPLPRIAPQLQALLYNHATDSPG